MDTFDINLMTSLLIIHDNYEKKWTLKWILSVSLPLSLFLYVEREISLFSQTCHLFGFFLLLLLLPSSLRGAVKMTTFHHLLFELLLWELPDRFFIRTVATETRCDHLCVETGGKCARQMARAGFCLFVLELSRKLHFD